MIVKRLFLLLLLFVPAKHSFSQKDTRINLVLLTNQTISEVNFNRDKFMKYMLQVNEEITDFFTDDRANRDVIILFTLKKDTFPGIDIFSRPAFPSDSFHMIRSRLQNIKPLYSRLVDYSFLYEIQTNGGSTNSRIDYSPSFMNPFVVSEQAFREVSLREKYRVIREWALRDVLPVLAAFAEQAEEEFKGVRVTGDRISEMNTDSIDILYLCDHSSYYWLGVMEMQVNNFLLMGMKVFLHTAAGEFDIAHRYLAILQLFKQDQTIADYFLDELDQKLSAFYTELNDEIDRGILSHDSGDYENAILTYSKLLESYPHSAWLKYELFMTIQGRMLSAGIDSALFLETWELERAGIFGCDPLYPESIEAVNENGQWEYSRRQEINRLFQTDGNETADLLNYADIAFDLGAWDFAAHLYWLVFTHFSEQDFGKRNIFACYLYCLDQLGLHDMIMQFDIQPDREFRRIEKERKKFMEESMNVENKSAE